MNEYDRDSLATELESYAASLNELARRVLGDAALSADDAKEALEEIGYRLTSLDVSA